MVDLSIEHESLCKKRLHQKQGWNSASKSWDLAPHESWVGLTILDHPWTSGLSGLLCHGDANLFAQFEHSIAWKLRFSDLRKAIQAFRNSRHAKSTFFFLRMSHDSSSYISNERWTVHNNYLSGDIVQESIFGTTYCIYMIYICVCIIYCI